MGEMVTIRNGGRAAMRKAVVVIAVAALGVVQFGERARAAEALSLPDAVGKALARDALVREAQQNLEDARAALATAKALTPKVSVSSSTSAASSAGLDPQSEVSGTDYSSQSYQSVIDVPMRGGTDLGLFTSASTSTTNSVLRAGGGSGFTYGAASAGASLSRPLPLLRDERALTEGPRWQAETGLRRAELALDDARRTVVGDTATHFFAALRSQRQAEIAAASKSESDELLRIAQEKLKVGKIAEIEVMQAEVSAASAGVTYRKAESAAATALDELKSFLGIPLEQEVQPTHAESGGPAAASSGESALLERALGRRADLKQLALGVRSAELSVRQSEAQARPGVFLTGGYMRSGEAGSIGESFRNLMNPSWYVGLASTVSLTRREDRASIERARSALRVARLDEQVRRDEVRLEIRRLMRQVQDAQANAVVLADTVKTAEGNLRIERVRFDHGLIPAIDVTRTERQLNETRNQQLEAMIDCELAAAQLSLAVGDMPGFAGAL
jgi:outer membrane protein TolC